MMENHKPSQISDQAIRAFLLGQLDTRAQENFEQSLFTDPELDARVRLAECEISDDYAFGRLGHSERTAFRERFLLTTDRRSKLQVSQALNDRFPSAWTPRIAISQRPRRLIDLKQPAWRYAFAALVLVLLFVTVLLVTKERRIVTEIISKRFRPKPAPTVAPQRANHPGAPPSPSHQEPYPPLQPHETSALEVALISGTPLEQAPTINISSLSNAAFRFRLSIENSQATAARAQLTTISGEAVLNADSLSVSGTNPGAVYFEVPRQVLKAGDYQIKLSRVDGTVNSYYFRVR